jgi:hypothetical protein
MAEDKAIPNEVWAAGLQAGIFREYETRINKVNLGGDVLKFFAQTPVASKVYLELLLMEWAQEALPEYEGRLWGPRVDLSKLHQQWEKWRVAAVKLSQIPIDEPSGHS